MEEGCVFSEVEVEMGFVQRAPCYLGSGADY